MPVTSLHTHLVKAKPQHSVCPVPGTGHFPITKGQTEGRAQAISSKTNMGNILYHEPKIFSNIISTLGLVFVSPVVVQV